ncbi:hypothetical protein BDV95DRAFT_482556 [Massariosphaeria phaeospora]|uniref:RING-type domain-containing protein n=1 Tax=Massariosphaeria phaeospora TaxID=100035 RepID=A0A7C8INA3_9PLEO|nr:hypothetical protein BDV95DRAFT_482556 [Massariosphaeria phaeospora]
MNTSRPSPTPPASARPKNPPPPPPSSSSITSSHAASSSSQQPATMASSSKPARGSTPSSSRAPARGLDGDRPVRPSSKDSLKQKTAPKADEALRPSRSDDQLRALRSDFDGLRAHITCKICDRLLYQPYIISCGHTYCYSCLCTWFVNNKAHKTCPDCRAVVTQPPAPAYLIRDMITVFIGRVELLPSGETVEQHSEWQREEADLVQLDKDNEDPRTGGLFKGCFRSHPARGPSLRAVRDREDGVDRCPLCSWELEDGECTQCGLFFDDNGELTWGDSFTGFSDMDEMSEHDVSGEDLDAEMDMEEAGLDGFGEPMDGWQDYLPDDGNLMMRRFLEHGIPPHIGRRRPLTHSEAGSRRPYSQSIVSDMYTDEMDTVEEEDEEGVNEDSSMNDFLDDEESTSTNSPSASSGPGRTPQPSNNRPRLQGRARPVVESETSSSVSNTIDEEDDEDEEDEEDAGPIRRGQRNRAQSRILRRANGSQEPSGPPSSTSTDVSTEDLDERTQAMLREEGWMLQHDGPDDDMGEEDDSDGGRTTVGWDATAISNDRVRMGGSLTPTADRPRPNAFIRPPSRVGDARFMDASRGLRRRSSVLSASTVNYEDPEDADDDSDQDGDIAMAMNSLRTRRSRAQMRPPAAFSNMNNRFINRGIAQGDAIDMDTDDNSDNSQTGARRSSPLTQRQEYNPRISWMFADHQRALREFQRPQLLDLEPRSTTPIARPRTSNRSRQSPAQAYSPFMPPTRLRTPLMDNSSNLVLTAHAPTSPPRRMAMAPTLPATSGAENARTERSPSVSSISNASVVFTPGTSANNSSLSVNSISQAQTQTAADMIDRPPSRVSARPPSATGRRTPGFSPVYQSFPHTSVGLSLQGRIFPNQAAGNPWATYMARGIRNRNSRPALRDQSSTVTLRAASSRANIREGVAQPQAVRSQTSRIDLRAQPSRRRLNNQSSTRTLRASEHAQPPSPTTNLSAPMQSSPRSTRITPDERESRARELVNSRRLALAHNPLAHNPFFRQANIPPDALAMTAATNVPVLEHSRSNSNETINSNSSSTTTQATPSSPNLNRRRSNRNMTANPTMGISPAHGIYPPSTSAYTTNYLRARQGSVTGASPIYESSLAGSVTRMSPMVAGPLI